MPKTVFVEQGGLFLVIFNGQFQPDPRSNWNFLFQISNLAIEENWFNECVVKCFGEEAEIAKVVSFGLKMSREEKVEDVKSFLEEKATELLELLKTHPLWGEEGGPDLRDDYEL